MRYNIKSFIDQHYLHFNAATLKDAAIAYKEQVESGHKMMITLAGAMSTAELGKSLAAMIRKGKVDAICCTGANLEEDIFNLVAHNYYKRIPDYQSLSAADELDLLKQHYNRVTDTCIPEEEAMRRVERPLIALWQKAVQNNQSFFPHEYIYAMLASNELANSYQIDPLDSWVMAAYEANIPIFVPGWEDSTLGNVFAAQCLQGLLPSSIMKNGIDYMVLLAKWYKQHSQSKGIGFFQIGGGIAGDFPICVVPMINQDIKKEEVPLWSYFCQISDARTSYGSYSGAPPNEKITWGKLGIETPRFMIESDATIVAPLIFAYILDW